MTTYETQTIFFAIRYRDPRAAIAWLERCFGATRHVVYDAPDGGVAHAELHLFGNTFMLGMAKPGHVPETVAYVVIDEASAIDAFCERVRATGATIAKEPYDTEYGSHDFAALDGEGNTWSFGTYRPGVAHGHA